MPAKNLVALAIASALLVGCSLQSNDPPRPSQPTRPAGAVRPGWQSDPASKSEAAAPSPRQVPSAAASSRASGGLFNGQAASWKSIPNAFEKLSHRGGSAAVWAGDRMIIWAGGNSDLDDYHAGMSYFPATGEWRANSNEGGPDPDDRYHHCAVWTGSKMIVWGGSDHRDGGIYCPKTDTWKLIPAKSSPPWRTMHSAVWAGDRMIVWGGSSKNSNGYLRDGHSFDPETGEWNDIPAGNAPRNRRAHTAVWTGSRMIVWGGMTADDNRSAERLAAMRHGDRVVGMGHSYDPKSGSWASISLVGAPDARAYHSAVWTGTHMLIWGGATEDYENPVVGNGAAYNPTTDSWERLPGNAPAAMNQHVAVWTGTHMLAYGAASGNDDPRLFSLGPH